MDEDFRVVCCEHALLFYLFFDAMRYVQQLNVVAFNCETAVSCCKCFLGVCAVGEERID